MLLMYHHICPRENVPATGDQADIEGWAYNLEPQHFEFQLKLLMKQGFEFVPISEYIRRCEEGHLDWGVVSVTFDDGWLDNYQYAYPILADLGIPATIFVPSGKMAHVSSPLRIGDAQMRELAENGMTIGAHSRTHQNLTGLSELSLRMETKGCKDDLEQRLGRLVECFAYPGGRFSRRVVEAVESAGFRAACSIISGGLNDRHNLFWLYRDVFSMQMDSLRDRIFLNGFARKLLNKRARNKAEAMLRSNDTRRIAQRA
jgi:peptidoglycan/xylan/chitin deacetylase (PgdA/CDA1 family)